MTDLFVTHHPARADIQTLLNILSAKDKKDKKASDRLFFSQRKSHKEPQSYTIPSVEP